MQHRLCDVLREDVDAEHRAVAVVLLEVLRGDPVRVGALLRQLEPQIREPCSTASGLTVFTRIPAEPPSSARQRARCSSAALAVE